MATPNAPPAPPRRRFRLSVRGLIALVAVIGLAMGLGQFWLANLNTDRATLSYQMRMLADRALPAESRVGAIDGMTQAQGRQARRAMKLLTATLDDPDPVLRAESARMIAKLGRQLLTNAGAGPSARSTVLPGARALLDAIDDPDAGVAHAAIRAIAYLDWDDTHGLFDRDALSSKLHAFLSSDRGQGPDWAAARREAIDLLAARELEPGDVPSWIRVALNDPDPQTRLVALTALTASIGLNRYDAETFRTLEATAAPDWLLMALRDEAREVREFAVWNSSGWLPGGGRITLWVDPERVDEALRQVLDEVDDDERPAVIFNLIVNTPEAAPEFAPEVIRRLEAAIDSDPWQWDIHLRTLEHLGLSAQPAAPVLRQAARRAQEESALGISDRAIRVLASLDPESPEALAQLDTLLDRWLRSALRIIGSLQFDEAGLAGIRNDPWIDRWIGSPTSQALLADIRRFGPAARQRAEGRLLSVGPDPYEREAVRRLALEIDPALLPDEPDTLEDK